MKIKIDVVKNKEKNTFVVDVPLETTKEERVEIAHKYCLKNVGYYDEMWVKHYDNHEQLEIMVTEHQNEISLDWPIDVMMRELGYYA